MKSDREQIGQGTRVDFVQDTPYLLGLQDSVVERVKRNPESAKNTLNQAIDVTAVASIQLTPLNCKADRQLSDLLIACSHATETLPTVVLFARGLCDRCEFEPIVFRKK